MEQGIAPRADAGFTLIELMVVITILALLSVSVTLGLSRPRSGAGQDWVRFAALHDRLRDRAILAGVPQALSVTADGYRRLDRQGGDWVSAGDLRRWQESVVVIEPRDPRAPLVVTPAGSGSPLHLRFQTGGGVTTCISDGWAPVSCSDG